MPSLASIVFISELSATMKVRLLDNVELASIVLISELRASTKVRLLDNAELGQRGRKRDG